MDINLKNSQLDKFINLSIPRKKKEILDFRNIKQCLKNLYKNSERRFEQCPHQKLSLLVYECQLNKTDRKKYVKWLESSKKEHNFKTEEWKVWEEIYEENISSIFIGNNSLHYSLSEDIILNNLLENSLKSSGYADTIFIDRLSLTSPRLADIDFHTSAIRSLILDNAGGNSKWSEALSIQYFVWRFRGYSFILEKEVEYWAEYKMIDFICTIDNKKSSKGKINIGVSVSRALHHINDEYFTIDLARKLLKKKLYGLIISRNTVMEKQSFYKSILHIWCKNKKIAFLIRQAYSELDIDDFGLDVKGTLITILTICDNEDIYFDRFEQN